MNTTTRTASPKVQSTADLRENIFTSADRADATPDPEMIYDIV